jgi:hypothetical protein
MVGAVPFARCFLLGIEPAAYRNSLLVSVEKRTPSGSDSER